ncbi:MAG: DUF1553 domain-containing protein, partial [Acidobacteria bacterium]|nr:DUF1553 domain-containing protein [Acidobacteriota bacterium]
MKVLFVVVSAAAFAQPKPVDFQREVRPILSNACYHCHGPDKATRMANLRLDVPGPAIVAGNVEQSKLWQRINHANAALRMPPEHTHKVISPDQKAVLRRWIEEGGAYKSHWSFATPVRPAVPVVRNTNWVRNPIDNFLLARMESEGLTPAAEADKRTLARRLSFDLTGLPPAPADVESFVQDSTAGAYDKLVDKFMSMPQYGEHRGRYWLDAARYGDTHGIHVDNYREMWSYRDWVINAFNRNQPFDQFTIEQLAGDLLPNPTIEQMVATGFHRCNITTNEGGSIEDEVAAVYAKDRADTTSTVWMGLTVGCATCHDHKFDPITQKEFYQMTAFFRNTTQKPMDGNIHDTPPVIVVPAERDRNRWLAGQKEERALRASREAHRKARQGVFEKWLADAKYKKFKEPFKGLTSRFAVVAPAALPEGVTRVEGFTPGTEALEFGKGKALEFPGLKADLDSRKPFTIAAWVYLPKAEGDYVIASKTDLVEKEDSVLRGWVLDFDFRRPRFQLHGGEKDDFLLIRTGQTIRLKAGAWHHVAVTFDGSRDYKGLTMFVNGKVQYTESNSNTGYGMVKGVTLAGSPLKLGGEHGKRGFEGGRLHDLRIIDRELRDDEVELLSGALALEKALASGAAPAGAAKETLELAYLNRNDKAWQKISTQWLASVAEQRTIARRSPVTHVMNEIKEKDPEAFVLFRGMYDQPRDRVVAGVPSILGGLPTDLPKNRMGLAKWLVAPEHPTMARVTVNRFWQETFGTGIVRSSEDFGAQGNSPLHPELLDWLAVEFRESGWDVKKLIRMMVTSSTYRQAAVSTEEKRKKDPENLLLSRGPRFRMDGEMVRDTALAASGLLVKTIGGPSVKPYQPNAIWETVAMLGSNTRFYKQDHGEKLYRRSMYTFWKRAAPPPSMDIFNAPSRENCTVKRERTNTPLQALVTMNDIQFVEAARNLAERTLKNTKGGFDERLDYLSAYVLARPFEERERAVVRAEYKDLLSHYD